MSRTAASFALYAAVLLPMPLSAAITWLEQDRGVFTRAHAIEGAALEEVVDADEASDFGLFVAAPSSSASTSQASASADAALDATLSDPLTEVSGSSHATAWITNADARATAPADAFHEVHFQVDAPVPVVLHGSLSAGALAGEAYASVELSDASTGIALFSHQALFSGSVAFSDLGMLAPGVPYRLRAFSLAYTRADAPGSAQADASFQLVMHVPEASGPLLLLFGSALLFGLERLRHR